MEKFYNHDISVLIRECEEFIYYIDEEEIDNDCSIEEQIFINAISNMMLAYNLMVNKQK